MSPALTMLVLAGRRVVISHQRTLQCPFTRAGSTCVAVPGIHCQPPFSFLVPFFPCLVLVPKSYLAFPVPL